MGGGDSSLQGSARAGHRSIEKGKKRREHAAEKFQRISTRKAGAKDWGEDRLLIP